METPNPTPEPEVIFSETDIKENKFVAAIGYLNIFFLIPLLLKKDSPFAQFHAKQGLYLFLVFFVGQAIFWFPIFGWGLFLFFPFRKYLCSLPGIRRPLLESAWGRMGD